MKEFINELFARVKSDTPLFFQRLKYFGTSLVAVGSSFQVIPHAPANLVHMGVHLIVAGSVMAAVSQLTIKAPDQK